MSRIGLAVVLVALASSIAVADSVIGRASVVDGDTIDVAGERVRLHGIDAPESRQTCEDEAGRPWACGRAAAVALDAFLAASRPVRCEYASRDRNGRLVGVCRRADGLDVNRWLVREGLARDWPRYSRGEYAGDEDHARKVRRGIWTGRHVEPWRWRRGDR